MTSCLTAADFEEYDRGRSDSVEAAEVRAHLASCDPCRVAYEQHTRDRSVRADAMTLGVDAQGPDSPTIADASSPASGAPKKHPKIEGYEITGVLGQGGMGIVYRAVQTKLNRAVALKVLPGRGRGPLLRTQSLERATAWPPGHVRAGLRNADSPRAWSVFPDGDQTAGALTHTTPYGAEPNFRAS